jgi:HD-like signal output (HDOD) protein
VTHRQAGTVLPAAQIAELARSVDAAVTARLADAHKRPEHWRELVDALALGRELDPRKPGRDLLRALAELRRILFAIPGHQRDCDRLWRESVSVAWGAAAIASARHGSPGTAGVAGLLHRAGDLIVLQAISDIESQQGRVMDEAVRSVLIEQFEAPCGAEVARRWKLPAAVNAAMQGWRRVTEARSPSLEAQAVYFATLLRAHSQHAGISAPGLAHAAQQAVGLTTRESAVVEDRMAAAGDVAGIVK